MKRRRVLESRLSDIMKQREITPTQLALKLRVSLKSIQLWSRGHGITVEYALKVANELGVSIEDIWQLKDNQ